ncbi:SRPBCC family protein [Jiangella asiatica]|uniref:SRPBCC domain-containing protein n=1 Tax=Jiangella asiatica TaxID=2530372 RepID=A0A4R5DU54_9ACTN|nr:SRPBCC domain-containing protein [Jiangella asiatica]TDE15984.1 SRPBCC domain-containing protein [Jiangella asiatica]
MSEKLQDSSGGFTVRRRLPATAERVYAAFVEPSRLEQWFVVPGYHTPADRMRVDAKAGGRMDAVMISDADGSEIPFGFEYTEVDPPRRVVFRFQEPRELVTVTLADAPDETVDLTYEFVSWPAPARQEASRRAVEDMLDLIETGIQRGTI